MPMPGPQPAIDESSRAGNLRSQVPELWDNTNLHGVRSEFERRMSDYRKRYLSEWGAEYTELCKLATACCLEYDRLCDLSYPFPPPYLMKRPPGRPSVGQIREKEIDTKYDQARALGFEGALHEWRHFVYQMRDPKDR